MRSGTRSTSETTPILSPLQESSDTPIIALAGLMRLAEWIEAHHQVIHGGAPCHETPDSLLPPANVDRSVAGDRPTLEPADGRAASTDAAHPQQHRDSTTRRASRRSGGAR
jgi:hypothetical protein